MNSLHGVTRSVGAHAGEQGRILEQAVSCPQLSGRSLPLARKPYRESPRANDVGGAVVLVLRRPAVAEQVGDRNVHRPKEVLPTMIRRKHEVVSHALVPAHRPAATQRHPAGHVDRQRLIAHCPAR